MLPAATTYYKWSGAGVDNNWFTDANWIGGVAPVNGNETIVQPQGTAKLAVTIDAPVSVNAIQFQGGSGAFVFSGSPITISGSANAIHTSANTQTFQSDVIFTNTANVVAQGGNFVFNNITIDAGNITLQPGTGRTITINGTVSGTSGSGRRLDVNSAGTVYLNGTATNAGGVRVYNGTLIVDGTVATGSGGIDMYGGTLRGKGTINRDITIRSGATFSPGSVDDSGASTTDALTIVGGVTFNTGSKMTFDLGDSVSVTGNVTFGSGSELVLSGFTSAGDYQLFSVTGSITDNGLTITGLPVDYSYTFTNGLLKVTAPIPEPAITTVFLGFITLVAFVISRRRKN